MLFLKSTSRARTGEYRRARGDMIEVYKILHGYYDPEAAPCPSTMHLSEYQRSQLEVVPTTVTSELQKVLIHCESSGTIK